ncbi:RHS repeat protein [Entomomonas asaccharolytica]|uniref:RHS repeat protein n=1 Tax=Entomomonas asaccharolytica TaxID=2785331 RepID=A0A974NG78_9GAMM|nr:RHS repeat protein [Entomomonas asaccharolytica]QQP86098.1 RHS repeat protein [Entomomonas asaccharolytica]
MKKQVIPMLLALAVSTIHAEQTIKYTYNDMGQITNIDGPRYDVEDITHYNYNNDGQLTSIVNPLGHTVIYSNFDNYGNPQMITDENGIVSTLTYTTQGWLASITTSASKTSFTYDAIGQITKVTFPDNSILSYTWDDAKRLTSIKNNLNDSIHYTYDAMGNRTEEVIKKGTTITYQFKRQFDELGRVLALVGSSNQVYQYSYGTHGKPLSETDPKGTQITHRYNPDNYLTMDTYGSNYTYHDRDVHGNVTRAKDFGSSSTWYTYSDLNQIVEEQSSARGITNYRYDKAGNLLKETNARGYITQYNYDSLNRLITQLYPDNTELNVEYIYDQPETGFYNIGYLTTINDNSGTTEYNYNNLGLVAQEKRQLKLDGVLLGNQQIINYTYDIAGRVLTTDYGLATLKYTRNTGGQITAITLVQNGRTLTLANYITYQPFGTGITGLKWKNDLTLNRSYDLDGQLTQQIIGSVTTDYQYDVNGNITQIADSQFGIVNYQYNELNRLTQEQATDTTNYTYNVVGNRTNRENSQGSLPIWFDDSGNIYNIYSIYYAKDVMNNITGYKDRTKRFEYDESNRFSKVIKTENNIQTTLARYIHNAYGERTIKVKEDSSISTFMYNDIGQLIGETQYNSAKEKVKEIYWAWLDTLPIAQIEVPFTNGIAGTQIVYYIHSDHLDTPRWATNQNGQKVWSWQSDAYGTTMANEDPLGTGINTTIPLRFAGQYFDQETDFHYNYFRTYIPDLGRYSQSDPIGLDGGWNTFGYVEGNPLMKSDKYGLWGIFSKKSSNWLTQELMDKIKDLGGEKLADYVSGRADLSCTARCTSASLCLICCQVNGDCRAECARSCTGNSDSPLCKGFTDWIDGNKSFSNEERVRLRKAAHQLEKTLEAYKSNSPNK